MKKIIRFHADDYGWDSYANEGILKCLAENILDGVSIMSTHADAKDLNSLRIYKDQVAFGLHFTLSKGEPKAITNSAFLTKEGKLLNSYQLCFLISTAKIKKEDIKKEFLFQLHLLYDHGIYPSYMDSHQHIHSFPMLHSLLNELIKDTGIQYIRNVNPFSLHDIRRMILKTMHRYNHIHTKQNYGSDVLITETLSEYFKQETVEDLLQQIALSHYTSFEFMWHPATKNRADSFMNREKDLHLLLYTPWKELFRTYGFTQNLI